MKRSAPLRRTRLKPRADKQKRGAAKRRAERLAKKRAIRALDMACRTRVFERDAATCQRCGIKEGEFRENGTPVVLQWSHVQSRRHLCVRWEDENSKVLCRECHHWWGMNPGQAFFWFSQKWPERWEHVGRILRVSPKVNVLEMAKELGGKS